MWGVDLAELCLTLVCDLLDLHLLLHDLIAASDHLIAVYQLVFVAAETLAFQDLQ